MKACPFCAEDLQDAAIVCKHCGRDLLRMRVDGDTARADLRGRGAARRVLLALGIVVALTIVAGVIGATIVRRQEETSRQATISADRQRLREILSKAPDTTPQSRSTGAIGLTIFADGLTIENRTDGPLDKCYVEILGGFVGRVPVIQAHGVSSRFFTELFGAHEADARAAGQTFRDYMAANAKQKTAVSCETLSGERIRQVFR